MTRETAKAILKELHDNSLFSVRTALETFFPEFNGDVESVKSAPQSVYLCILLHDDGCFKAIVGCFATREDAETYSCYRQDIVIQELKVGYYGKDNL